jgi:hypothetical protein
VHRLGATILRFRVEDWQAYVSGAEWRPDSGESPPRQGVSVPTLLRRRVSAIGQLALRAGFEIVGAEQARFIICSRHGEFDRTVSLLRSIAAREPLSPADFSLSVHNALAGLLSIATKNTRGHTAIAAGPDSFGYGVLEAALCLATAQDEKILVIYFDAPLPELYAAIDNDSAAPVALAVLMAPQTGGHDDIVMSFAPPDSDDAPPLPADRHSGEILDFLRAQRNELHIRGPQMTWRWARAG